MRLWGAVRSHRDLLLWWDRDGHTSPVGGNGNFRLMVRRLLTTLGDV